jgi:ABC-type dipeptide/oligopeptide/nickel transport system ATPase component
MDAYPFQLSGGENQRCLLAMGIALAPQLLILDEPLTSVENQFRINFMDHIQKIKSEYKITILIVTHNLALIEHLVDYIYIMHKGRIVEEGTFIDLVDHPKHHYTKEIISFL